MMTSILFYALSALAIWSGWRVFRVDSMIRATFALMVSFIAVGAIALLLSADYIGVATVFMMAVEMMVMGLFMIMFMMNPAGLNPMQMVHQYRFSIGAGVASFVGLSVAVLTTALPVSPLPPGGETLRDLGTELLGNSMLIFETAGVTLLATMVGAVVLSSASGRFGSGSQGAQPPGLTEGGAPAGRKVDAGSGHSHHGGGH
ncbi:NADH-quinone oxidoreductase subunit J [uncultured Thioclava sp.]|uniref:NADH-quinone oxidoreductase subunit J family protein n=1 Tax=uncultured Thioclava sp. TaxID=473858 RepID=UPI0025E2D528|nr:NADH-quinone oxidoreductase subunit J [uncultured Thioclava sp.]